MICSETVTRNLWGFLVKCPKNQNAEKHLLRAGLEVGKEVPSPWQVLSARKRAYI